MLGETLTALSAPAAPSSSARADSRTQLSRLALGMPSTLATTEMACPAPTRPTASSLNSCVYCARTCLPLFTQLLVDIFNKGQELHFSGATSNWLFVGSELAGQRAAVVMSLVQSAELNAWILGPTCVTCWRAFTRNRTIDWKSCCRMAGRHPPGAEILLPMSSIDIDRLSEAHFTTPP